MNTWSALQALLRSFRPFRPGAALCLLLALLLALPTFSDAVTKHRKKGGSKNGVAAGAATAAGAAAAVGTAGVAASAAAKDKPTPSADNLTGPQAEAAAAYAHGDYARAHQLWQQLADTSDPRAMNNLGVLYDKGQGVPEDPSLAAFWFLHSATAEHPAGMSNLGRLLEQGRGLPKDLSQAGKWFRKAADKGLAEAQYNLALMYENGQGFDKNDREAAAWYSRAAAQNQVDAQWRLGQMYREGRGVNKNATRAVLLLYGASMEGKSEAIDALEAMANDPQFRSVAAPSRPNPAVLFGLPLEHTTRSALRSTLAAARVPAVREDDSYICDVYNVRNAIPGATEMAACYGPSLSPLSGANSSGASPSGSPAPLAALSGGQALGFVKIDYPSPDKGQAEKISTMLGNMLVERFGPPSAAEGQGSALWNLGKVIVATQYSAATRETGLMYMVPRVYHLTRQKP